VKGRKKEPAPLEAEPVWLRLQREQELEAGVLATTATDKLPAACCGPTHVFELEAEPAGCCECGRFYVSARLDPPNGTLLRVTSSVCNAGSAWSGPTTIPLAPPDLSDADVRRLEHPEEF
jgi:hypothetical protein